MPQLARVQLFSELSVEKATHRVPRGRGNKQGVDSKRGSVSAEHQAMGYFAGKFGHGIEFQLMVVAPRGSAVQLRKRLEWGFPECHPIPGIAGRGSARVACHTALGLCVLLHCVLCSLYNTHS